MGHALTIGQVAKTTGVSAKTIRYYEQIGVLPAPSRTSSGYRQYDKLAVERLRFISRARSLGLPLRKLKKLTTALDGGPLRRYGHASACWFTSSSGVSPKAVGLLVSLGVLGRLVALWFGGSVSHRWGRMRVLIPGLIINAAFLGCMSWLTEPAVLGVASFAIGAAAGFVAAIPTALASDQVEPSLQGVAIGWIRTMSDTGQIVGPLVMGVLADAIDLSAPFLLGAALLGVTAWWCGRSANAMATVVAAGGRDS